MSDEEPPHGEGPFEQAGQCFCGAIKFQISGKMSKSVYCHCKACCRKAGMTPVHLVIARPNEAFKVTSGEEHVQIVKGYGSMEHYICRKCGGPIKQHPKGASFVATFPTTFQIEDGKNCLLPDKYKPELHLNYENRHYDWNDNLPKFAAFPPNGLVDNQGNPIEN